MDPPGDIIEVMFRDRGEAGTRLADAVSGHARPDRAVVLAIPRGGVVVAVPVAEALDALLEAIRRAGIRVLYNEKIDVDGLQIIGVDYRDSRKEDQFRTILQKMDIDRRKPSILLKHTPFHLQVARERGISIQLSGHTHHGQVFLFRFITAKVYQGYDYGLKWFGNLLVYTSSGAGT